MGVSPFSRGVIFTRARVSLALLSLRKNGDCIVYKINGATFFSTLILARFHNYAVNGAQLGAHLVHHFVFSLQTNKNILSVVRVRGALSM